MSTGELHPVAPLPAVELDVFVPSAEADMGCRAGSPAAQGSKEYRGHRRSRKTGRMVPVLLEVSKAVKPWRNQVAKVAWLAWQPRRPLTCPVGIRCDFVLPRPKGLAKSAPTPLATRKHHDGDKLERAAWDALTRVVFADDSLIVDWEGSKRIAEAGERPGCRIQVWKVNSC